MSTSQSVWGRLNEAVDVRGAEHLRFFDLRLSFDHLSLPTRPRTAGSFPPRWAQLRVASSEWLRLIPLGSPLATAAITPCHGVRGGKDSKSQI